MYNYDNLRHQEEWADGNGIAAALVKLNGGTDAEVKAAAENQLERCCDAHFTFERALKIARRTYRGMIARLTKSAEQFGYRLGVTHAVKQCFDGEFVFIKIA